MSEATLIKEYIVTELTGGSRHEPLSDKDDLLASGLIDSLGVIRLVTFMEDTFQINVPDEDVTFENFNNVSALVTYVRARRADHR